MLIPETDSLEILSLLNEFDQTMSDHFSYKFERSLYLLKKANIHSRLFLDQLKTAIPIAHKKQIISGETLFLSIFDRNMVLYWAKNIGLVAQHPQPHLAAIVAYEFLALNRSVVCKKRKAKSVARDFLVETNDLVKVANELSTELNVLRSLKICTQSKLRFESAYRKSETTEKIRSVVLDPFMSWRDLGILTPNELLALNGDL
jgi:hypothetical protein